MKFPISMLHDFVDTSLSAEEIGDLLTMAGFELEGIEEVEGEPVLDIKVVSNRGDGLSVYGLSREVLAKDAEAKPTALYLRAAEGYALGDEASEGAARFASVQIESEACSRYAARLFRDVTNLESPGWLAKRLRQAGMRPLGLLVDLTNYVMLELGQPLHAFDHDTLREGRIVVREARPGEKLTTLNGIEHELQPHQLMICDGGGVVASAGIMGGAETEVSESTRNVLLESAHFVNTSVRRTRKDMGLSTEASYRFERSVDPEGVVRALNRYADLLRDALGRDAAVPGVIDVYPRRPAGSSVDVRVSRACLLLGMEVAADQVRNYLSRLGFSVGGDGEPFTVASPSWRPDIVREEDLIEEIGRVHGYDKIPTAAPRGETTIGGLSPLPKLKHELTQALLRAGFVQTISHSLRDRHPLDSPTLEAIGPKNPGSPEMAYLRSSLWPSLSDAAQRNGSKDLHLFEIGRVHGSVPGKLVEGSRLGLLSTGRLSPEHWGGGDAGHADFFSLKSVLEMALRSVGRAPTFQPSADPRLHPTRQAAIVVEGAVGVLGQIHPDIAEELDLPAGTVLAAVDLEKLLASPVQDIQLHSISRNPAVRRDISVLMSKEISYGQLEQAVRAACGEVLESLRLFDVYTGKGVPEGSHSLSLALQLRKQGENFTDEEANQVRDAAVAALESLGGTRR
jgi:phenylalanyl-tRNA synthetase beta chain